MRRDELRTILESRIERDRGEASAEAAVAAIDHMCAATFGWAAVESELEVRLWLGFVGAQRWQPIRILLERPRRRGFPERAPDIFRMRAWCAETVRHGWALENRTAGGGLGVQAVTFWFENAQEAARFALKWMPMKCT